MCICRQKCRKSLPYSCWNFWLCCSCRCHFGSLEIYYAALLVATDLLVERAAVAVEIGALEDISLRRTVRM